MAVVKAGPSVSQLVVEHHQALYRYAYRLTGSVQDAEDLTQQVFLVALRKIEQLRNIDNAKSWLYTILRNCFLRSRQRRRPSLATDLSMQLEKRITAHAKEEADIDRDRLQEVLNQLSDVFRLVVVMYYFEDCSYKEIAEKLRLPIGTVMSRLARAKHHLRLALSETESSGLHPAGAGAEQG